MICGVAAPTARQLMRAYSDERPIGVASDVLGLDRDAARDHLQAFEAAGYLRRSERLSGAKDSWWVTTIRGDALAQASFGKPITRATATRNLALVIERVRAYNADPSRLLTVAEVAVFGSYLDPAAGHLGDLDLAVATVRRESDGERYVDKVLAYSQANGRYFGAFHEELFWPIRELLMILKKRSPAISITNEDVSRFTDRFETVYSVDNDPDAIPPPPGAVVER